jgi:predicted RND superfamily exporter protein
MENKYRRTNGEQIPDNSEEIKHCIAEFPNQITRNLVNDDYTAANIIVGLMKTEQNEADQLREIREELRYRLSGQPDNIQVAVTGARSLGPDLLDAFTSGRMKITLIGIGLVFLGLLFLFRFNLLKAFLATIPIGLIIGWSSGIMYTSGTKYTALTACLGALILGIGVEYTILLLRRYYEEREKAERPKDAMISAITRIGRPILASGFTTIAGFAALLSAGDMLLLREFGIMTVVDVFLAILSTLILLPALVVWIDSWRERRRLVPIDVESTDITSE